MLFLDHEIMDGLYPYWTFDEFTIARKENTGQSC